MAPVTQGPLTGQAARTSVVEFASDRPCYHPQAGHETLIVVCLACQLAHQLTATAAREIIAPSDAIHAIETGGIPRSDRRQDQSDRSRGHELHHPSHRIVQPIPARPWCSDQSTGAGAERRHSPL